MKKKVISGAKVYDSLYLDKNLKKHAEVLAGQARAGDVLAATELLRNAMVALSHVIDSNSINTSGNESLKFLHACIRGFLIDEIPIERAFCIEESHGAPKKNKLGEAMFMVLKVDDEIDRQVSSKRTINVSDAIKKAATKIKNPTQRATPIDTVRVAWESLGGLKGYRERKEWIDEMLN